MNFTDKLDLLMERRGITRGKLAEETGIPYNTIVGFYTKGYRNMKLSNLKRLCEYFGLPLDVLADDDAPLQAVRELPRSTNRYDRLPDSCKKIVDGVIDGLLGLPLQEEATAETPEPAPVTYIREFLTPAAAGYANPALGEDYALIPRGADVPADADFACRIAGDSMEPYIPDGSMVYVRRDSPLSEFDVGVFFVDGDVYCKQWCTDYNGTLHLLSANPARQDANISLPRLSGRSCVCFGKVILPRRLPRPVYY